jgi:hypothetical protein
MKNRPELKDRISWVRKLVKGERKSFFHTGDFAIADVEMPG